MVAFIDPPRLPVIGFAPFESGGQFRDHVAAQIDWAASEFGIFYIVGHRVDLSAIERLIVSARSCACCKAGSKMRVSRSVDRR